MSRRDMVVELVMQVVRCDKPTAEMLLDRLADEGVLHLGYGDAEIDIIVDRFKQVFGNTKTTRYDRFAARRLAEKYGAQAVVGIIGMLASNADNKYAPVINSVQQLEEKWVSVLSFVRKQAEEGGIIDA